MLSTLLFACPTVVVLLGPPQTDLAERRNSTHSTLWSEQTNVRIRHVCFFDINGLSDRWRANAQVATMFNDRPTLPTIIKGDPYS